MRPGRLLGLGLQALARSGVPAGSAHQAEGRDVYAYFNNDDSGYAVEDARWFADRLGHRPGNG